MRLQSSKLRNSLLVFAVLLLLAPPRGSAQGKPSADQPAEAQPRAKAKLQPLPRDNQALEAAQEGPDFLRRRQDWFFKPRAFPLGYIPHGARQRALQQKMQMLEREGGLNILLAPSLGFVTPGPATSVWQPIGPQATSSTSFAPFTSGRVTALAVNPNNPNNAYLGAADGGLWATTDGGATWTSLTDFPPSAGIGSVAVGALAVDRSSCASGTGICTTVYVGTGEDNFGVDNVYGEGVLKCTVAAGPPLAATCTQDNTFHTPSPLDDTRGGPMIAALAINPKTSGSTAILLAGVRGRSTALRSGIYCSADSGSTWAPVFGISGIVGTDAVFASDGTAFVALGFPFGDPANNGIYKSSVPVSSCTSVTDASGTSPGGPGSKWIKQSLPAGTPAASLGRIALAIAPSATSTGSNAIIYAAIADATTASANFLGLLKTTNGGTTPWTQLTGAPAFCNSQCFFDLALAVHPTDPNTVFAGGSASSTVGGSGTTLARSTDGGTTWTDISRVSFSDGIHVDTHAFAMDAAAGVLYVGTDGGVWKTTAPKGTTAAGFWSNLNQNLSITQFYPGISIHPSTPLSGLGGTQDNDIQQYQGSLVWQSQQIGCDGGFTAIDPHIPSTIYGECEYEPGLPNFPFIVVAFDGGQIGNTGFLANTGINNTDRGLFIPPLVMDLSNPQNLYFGTCRVWQSMDGANTWKAISPDVTTPSHPAGCPVPTAAGQPSGSLTMIAVAARNSSVIYVGSDNGDIEVSANGGTTWTSIATSALPTRSVTQVAVDPSSPTGDVAYVTFSGFGSCATFCDGKGHVFKTVNGTAGTATVWTEIDGITPNKLPDIPVNAIVVDPDDTSHNTLYVATDIGAFFTTNGGTASWSPMGAANSLPPAEILGLTLHEPSRTLRAATHGRGVWDLNLGGQSAFGITSIAPFTANAGGPTIASFTVNGNGFTPGTSTIKFTINGSSTTLTPTSSSATQLTAAIPAANLASGGAAQVSVVNGATSTNSVVFTVLNPVPGITSISPTSTPAGTNGLTLTVNGSNFLTGPNQTLVLFNSVPLPASAVTVQSSAALTVQVPSSNIATPQTITVDTFNPQPGGGPDANPTPPTLTVTAATGSFTVSGTATAVTAGSSGMSTITVTPSGGFTGMVNVTCPSASLPPGVTCSPNPLAVTVPSGGGNGTGTLTVSVMANSSTLSASAAPIHRELYAAGLLSPGGKGWWALSASTGLGALLLLLLQGKRRYRTALALGLICVLSFTLGCNGGYGGGGGGTAASTTKVSVTSTKVASGTSVAFTVNITSTGRTPTGSVQLYDGTSLLGAAASLSNGSATISASGLAVGTHAISAHYLGDSYTLASQSGNLSIAITGTTNVAITATSGSTTANGTVNLTIN